MFSKLTIAALLANLAAIVASVPRNVADFEITLTNTNLSTNSVYYASGDGAPVDVNSTTAFHVAYLDQIFRPGQAYIPEFSCRLLGKDPFASFDLWAGKTGLDCRGPTQFVQITCKLEYVVTENKSM